MYQIALTQGKFTLVSRRDYTNLKRHKWYAWCSRGKWYARRNGRDHSAIFMHRIILGLGTSDTRKGDHRNGDGLDNRRSNLRIATLAQNQHNRRLAHNNLSGASGVRWDYGRKRWKVEIAAGGKRHFVGRYATRQAAIQARKQAENKLWRQT